MSLGLRVSQWLSVVLIGLGIFIILTNRKKALLSHRGEENKCLVAYIFVMIALRFV